MHLPLTYLMFGPSLAADVWSHGAAPASPRATANRIHTQVQLGQRPVIIKIGDLSLGLAVKEVACSVFIDVR